MTHKIWLKKLGFKEIRVNMGLFDFDVLCVIGKYENINEYIRFKFDDKEFDTKDWDNEYTPRGKCFFRTGFVPVIWIPKYPSKPREYATLSHESLHAVFHLFLWAGTDINKETEEVATHSMAHIINSILESKNSP